MVTGRATENSGSFIFLTACLMNDYKVKVIYRLYTEMSRHTNSRPISESNRFLYIDSQTIIMALIINLILLEL